MKDISDIKHAVFKTDHSVENSPSDTSVTRRNGRTIMSDYQRQLLTDAYERNKFPSKDEKMLLSQVCGLPFTVVYNWFHNKRRKDGISETSPAGIRNGRTLITPEQRQQLENAYSMNKFPSKEEKLVLSDMCGLPYMFVFNWFQNRRRKDSLPS